MKRLKANHQPLSLNNSHMNKTPDVKPRHKVNRKLVNDHTKLIDSSPKVHITVDCVIFSFEEDELKVLLIRSDLEAFKDKWSLLGDIVRDSEELDEAANRVMHQHTGMKNTFLEQVKAFSNPTRLPGGRVITLAYCLLLNVNDPQLKISGNELHWHSIKKLGGMAFDQKEIMEECYRWLQKRIQEHPVGFNLLPDKFSLRELQNLYESILEIKLDRRNFRKKFFSMNLLIDIEEVEEDVPHRPGKLYKFNYEKYEKNKKKWFYIDF
jgi:8-oxo-dGTP diphosphatase